MNETKDALYLIGALERLGVEYVIFGSFASNFWGEPRATRDVDIVCKPDSLDVSELAKMVESEYRFDPQMRLEGVTGTSRYVLQHRRSGFQAELFLLTLDAFDQSRFARRTRADLAGTMTSFVTAEDVIVQKLHWLKLSGEHKHKDDVRKVVAVQRTVLDWKYIRRWTEQHGTSGLLDEILSTLGDNPQ